MLLSSAKRLLPGQEPQRACMKCPKESALHATAKAPGACWLPRGCPGIPTLRRRPWEVQTWAPHGPGRLTGASGASGSKPQGHAERRGRGQAGTVPQRGDEGRSVRPAAHVPAPARGVTCPGLSPAAATSPLPGQGGCSGKYLGNIWANVRTLLFGLPARSAAVTRASTPPPCCSTGGPRGERFGSAGSCGSAPLGPGPPSGGLRGAAPAGARSPRGAGAGTR